MRGVKSLRMVLLAGHSEKCMALGRFPNYVDLQGGGLGGRITSTPWDHKRVILDPGKSALGVQEPAAVQNLFI